MHVFEMVAIITVVAIFAGVFKEWLSKKDASNASLDEFEGRLSRLESLEDRIVTLEAIVTDKGYDLKTEIENLR